MVDSAFFLESLFGWQTDFVDLYTFLAPVLKDGGKECFIKLAYPLLECRAIKRRVFHSGELHRTS